ncbi:MAG: thiamine-phosphate diphosphorylase [Candidatus Brocadia sp. UTAMX2]|jgi:thiamine-phosphate pyrophosphorylase|nr:MAG: thiamine-phosphate diphosphorylase [Candidatus Brocadia sp. UTAMX2]
MNRQQINNLSLVLITDRNLCKQSFLRTIRLALKGGVKTVQLREKGVVAHELYCLARELRRATLDFCATFIVNERVDIALAVEADGVHLGWQSIPVAAARRLLGSEKLIGVSTHSRQEALQARDAGANYITFGPIFNTPSKEGLVLPTGAEAIRSLKNEVGRPVIALGGIHQDNVENVLHGGADGIAVISSIMAADNPEEAARSLAEKITTFWSGTSRLTDG